MVVGEDDAHWHTRQWEARPVPGPLAAYNPIR
jgi:hypothetical protein